MARCPFATWRLGMGRLGTFKEPQLRMLASSVVRNTDTVAPDAQLCMVLIEAGFGNLQIEESGTSWDSANTKATGPPISTRSRDCFSAGLLDGQRVGAALMAARSALFDRRHTIGEELGSVWAAYQHYRDPTRNVFDDRNPSTPRRATAK